MRRETVVIGKLGWDAEGAGCQGADEPSGD